MVDVVNRKKFTTAIDENILAELSSRAKRGNFGTVNKVIESLANNFLQYLDDEGNIKLNFFAQSVNDLPQPVVKELLQNFAIFLKQGNSTSDPFEAVTLKNRTVNHSDREDLDDEQRKTEQNVDNFLNNQKF